MLTSTGNTKDGKGRANRRSRIKRGLVAAAGAVALASGALAFSAAPAFAATSSSVVMHSEHDSFPPACYDAGIWQVGCPYPPVQR
jgi:hypothetical protein